MDNTDKKPLVIDCKICRVLEGGICSNFCLMDSTQQKAFMKKHKHLFRDAK
ncbi:MAG: hypothetical protein ACI87J_001546 [Colwellia sp.]|jgi:hypothetical protein